MERELYKLDVKNLLTRGTLGEKEVLDIKDSHRMKLDEENVLVSYSGKAKCMIIGNKILADFSINYVAETTCARCLEKFMRNGKLSLDREYLIGRKVAEKGELIVGRDLSIKVSEPIKEEIVFDIPMKPLCKKDCKGIK